jgi:ribosomal protein S6--L-glutamate ligase
MPGLWVLTDSAHLRDRMPRLLLRALRARGIEPRTVVSNGGQASWRGLERCDLVVARTCRAAGLALLEAAELHGARTFEPAEAMRTVRNKAQVALALARAGVAVPETVVAYAPEQAARLGFPLVLKPVFHGAGGGVRVVHTRCELARERWDGTPVLAQAYVATGGVDLRLYVAGERVWALRCASPLLAPGATGRPVALTGAWRALALECARQVGLRLAAVTALETPGGPLVVGLEPFPNYSGVPEAGEAVADEVVTRLAVSGRRCER